MIIRRCALKRRAKHLALVLLFLLSSVFRLIAQDRATEEESLSLKSAIALALENNFAIRVQRDSAVIAHNNNTLANAGLLPTVYGQGGYTYSNTDITQAFSSQPSIKQNGTISTNKSADLALSYTLFNGLKMFANKRRLEEVEFLYGTNLKLQMETTILQVMLSYFNVIRQIQNEHVSMEAIRIDDERIKIADTKFKVGAGNKIDLLQAQVDRNQDQSLLMAQQITLDSTKVFLNQLLARDVNTPFELADTNLVVSFSPSYSALIDSATRKNYTLKSAASAIRIAKYMLKQSKADFYPVLNLNGGYYFNRSTNSAGFSLYNQSVGPQFGLNLSWTLFDGGNVRRRLNNAKLYLHANEMGYESTYSMVIANLTAQYKSFQNATSTLQLEDDNVKVARENLKIALEKYRLGASTQIDLMTAEQSLTASLNRLVLARYRTKLFESNLLRLSGALVN